MKSAKSIYPKHWKIVRLGDYVISEKGKKPQKLCNEQTKDCSLPYIDIKAFEKGIVDKYTDGKKCRLCYEDDILMVWDGSRSGLVSKGMTGALGSTLVRLNFPNLLNDYAYYFMKSKYQEINTRAKGATTPHVDPQLLWNYELPLPPLDEQKRIVAKIESLLSELDRSIEGLKRAKEKLKRYRQAVLKAAFEGKLTEEWRKAHTHELEDAQTLLERIKQERQAAYEAKLAEWEAEVKAWEEGGRVGKRPTKPKKPKELPPLSEEELEALPKLPEGWKWIRMDAAGEIQLGRQRSPKHHHGKFMRPYLRVANVFENRIDVTDLLEMNFTPEEFKIYKLEYGDILLNEGQSLELVGRPAMFRNEIENACFQNTLIRFRPFKSVLNEYALYLFLNYFHSQVFQKIASWTTSIAHLGAGRFSNLTFPICSNKEQKEIVSRIRRLFEEADIMEKTIDISLKKAESLRQSILKSAFEGRLVEGASSNNEVGIMKKERKRRQ